MGGDLLSNVTSLLSNTTETISKTVANMTTDLPEKVANLTSTLPEKATNLTTAIAPVAANLTLPLLETAKNVTKEIVAPVANLTAPIVSEIAANLTQPTALEPSFNSTIAEPIKNITTPIVKSVTEVLPKVVNSTATELIKNATAASALAKQTLPAPTGIVEDPLFADSPMETGFPDIEEIIEDTEDMEENAFLCYIIILILMSIYVIVGTYMETNKCGFGHETGVVIILGILIAAILKHYNYAVITAQFSPELLFDFGLPLILYAAGFNMRRRRFFENINNITMFGVLSTVVCFIILTTLTTLAFNHNLIFKFEQEPDGHWIRTTMHIPTMEISLICAMLCSSDIIAAVSLVKYKDYPTIFSILLGEGLWNDAVAVVLAQSAEKLVEKHEEYTFYSVGMMVGQFVYLSVVSALIGVVFGLLSGLVTRLCRFLTRNSVHETFTLIVFAFLSYYIADMREMSGIISIIVTAVMQA